MSNTVTMTYPSKIEKQDLVDMPICSLSGKITVIDKPEDVDAAVAILSKESMIGFDTETRPSFKKGESNSISLLQLATKTHSFLFRLHLIGSSQSLKELLESMTIRKVGLSVHDDFRALNKWMPVCPKNFIELQMYVKPFGIEEMGLQKIFAILFQERISKKQQLSNWENKVLSPAQQMYASIDAWACLAIYAELHSNVFTINVI